MQDTLDDCRGCVGLRGVLAWKARQHGMAAMHIGIGALNIAVGAMYLAAEYCVKG